MKIKRLYTKNGDMDWHALAETLSKLDMLLMKMGKYEQGRLTRERLVQEILLNYRENLGDIGKKPETSNTDKIIQFKKIKEPAPGNNHI